MLQILIAIRQRWLEKGKVSSPPGALITQKRKVLAQNISLSKGCEDYDRCPHLGDVYMVYLTLRMIVLTWAVVHAALTYDSRSTSRRILTILVVLCVISLRILKPFKPVDPGSSVGTS